MHITTYYYAFQIFKKDNEVDQLKDKMKTKDQQAEILQVKCKSVSYNALYSYSIYIPLYVSFYSGRSKQFEAKTG